MKTIKRRYLEWKATREALRFRQKSANRAVNVAFRSLMKSRRCWQLGGK